MTTWIKVLRAVFDDEMEADNYMIEYCMNNGFYRSEQGRYKVYEWIEEANNGNHSI